VLTPEKYTFCEQQQTQFSGCNATQTLGSNCRASFYPNFPNSLRIDRPSLWLSNAPKIRSKFQLLTLQRQTNVRLYFCTHQSRLLEKMETFQPNYESSTSLSKWQETNAKYLQSTLEKRRGRWSNPIPPRASWAPSQVAMRSPKSAEILKFPY
jgi:hypothetical protein